MSSPKRSGRSVHALFAELVLRNPRDMTCLGMRSRREALVFSKPNSPIIVPVAFAALARKDVPRVACVIVTAASAFNVD